MPRATSKTSARSRELTGRMVLVYLLAFFGVVFVVNGIMVHMATSTFAGLATESSYKAGLAFKAEEDAAQAQDARHWHVAGHIARGTNGEVSLRIDVVNRDGAAPARRLAAQARLVHPTDARFDREIALAQTGAGRFAGTADAQAGQWDLVLELRNGSERLFRSRNRIVLH